MPQGTKKFGLAVLQQVLLTPVPFLFLFKNIFVFFFQFTGIYILCTFVSVFSLFWYSSMCYLYFWAYLLWICLKFVNFERVKISWKYVIFSHLEHHRSPTKRLPQYVLRKSTWISRGKPIQNRNAKVVNPKKLYHPTWSCWEVQKNQAVPVQ